MKILLPIFILIFAVGISAQVKKSVKKQTPVKPANEAGDVIYNDLLKRKRVAEDKLAQLRTKYTDDFPEVQKLLSELAGLTKQVNEYAASHSVPLTLDTLPDDPTMLLKLIIIQNQQIIELLKQKPKAQ